MSAILVELQETMGSDASIANAAWVSSYDKEKRGKKTDADIANLVPRLVKDGHSVPLESVIFRFWIRLPIYIDREHMTHRIASHNGLSGRYRTMPEDFYDLPPDSFQVLHKIMGSSLAQDILDGYRTLCTGANKYYREILALAQANGAITNEEYKRLRETIRGVLPIANMVERTTIFNLRSFANYYRLRGPGSGAAPEIQTIAELMLEEVEKAQVCPIAINALRTVGWRI